MNTPKSSPEQIQDKIDNATTGNDVTNEKQQLNMKAGAFLKLIPEVSAGFDPSVSRSALPFTSSFGHVVDFAMDAQFRLHTK